LLRPCCASVPSVYAYAVCVLGPRHTCCGRPSSARTSSHRARTSAASVPASDRHGHHCQTWPSRSLRLPWTRGRPHPARLRRTCRSTRAPAPRRRLPRAHAPALPPAARASTQPALHPSACAARARSVPAARASACCGRRARPPLGAARAVASPDAAPPKLDRGEEGRQGKCPGQRRRRWGEDKRQREEKQRRTRKGISQGLMRKSRKLQGPFCKASISH
jgi:hypothetical protein